MADVMDKRTFRIKYSQDTSEFLDGNWVINPDKHVIANVERRWWVIDGDVLREMSQFEKDELEYTTNSTIYFILSGAVLTGVDGSLYEGDENAIINPMSIEGGWEYGKIVSGLLVEMDVDERAEYDWTHKSVVYLISEKELLRDVDATPYESDSNAIINPVIPEMVELKFTEVIDNTVVEMPGDAKDAIKADEAALKAAEDAAKELEKVESDKKAAIAADVAVDYTLDEQIDIILQLITGALKVTDADAQALINARDAAKLKHELEVSELF